MDCLDRDMKVLVVVMALAILMVVNPTPASATQHVVGGSQGWDVSADLSSWASSQTFKIGDQLVFKYTPGFHGVVELGSEKDYKKCDMSGALESMNGGTSVVKLDKRGTRYFTCGTIGHCGQGMKVEIKVLAPNESSPSSKPPSVASSTPASASTSSASASGVSASYAFLAAAMAAGWLPVTREAFKFLIT